MSEEPKARKGDYAGCCWGRGGGEGGEKKNLDRKENRCVVTL